MHNEEKEEDISVQDHKSKDEEEDEVRLWTKRVELPIFEGVDPQGCLSRAETFFEVQKVKKKEKLRLAYINMEGNASYWFNFWRKEFHEPILE